MSARVNRVFRLGSSVSLEALAEVFSVTGVVNEIARNTDFGAGAYPDSPAATFNQVTAVGAPWTWQLALRLRC